MASTGNKDVLYEDADALYAAKVTEGHCHPGREGTEENHPDLPSCSPVSWQYLPVAIPNWKPKESR